MNAAEKIQKAITELERLAVLRVDGTTTATPEQAVAIQTVGRTIRPQLAILRTVHEDATASDVTDTQLRMWYSRELALAEAILGEEAS
jgi:hypothetical protein